MSTNIKIKKAVEKSEETDKSMEQTIQLRIKAVATAIARSLNLSDPDVASWLSTRLAELALFLQHAPTSFSTKVILMLLDVLPDYVGAEVVKYYVDRIDRAYRTISQLASRIAPTRTLGMGSRDPISSIIYMLAEQYLAQQLGQTQQTQAREPASPSSIPDELKRIIDQLSAAEDKGESKRAADQPNVAENKGESGRTADQPNMAENKGSDN